MSGPERHASPSVKGGRKENPEKSIVYAFVTRTVEDEKKMPQQKAANHGRTHPAAYPAVGRNRDARAEKWRSE